MNNSKQELINRITEIHTTYLGEFRIRRNIGLADNVDIIKYTIQIINSNESTVLKNGKNYYVSFKGIVFTINKNSMTIITAHFA